MPQSTTVNTAYLRFRLSNRHLISAGNPEVLDTDCFLYYIQARQGVELKYDANGHLAQCHYAKMSERNLRIALNTINPPPGINTQLHICRFRGLFIRSAEGDIPISLKHPAVRLLMHITNFRRGVYLATYERFQAMLDAGKPYEKADKKDTSQ